MRQTTNYIFFFEQSKHLFSVAVTWQLRFTCLITLPTLHYIMPLCYNNWVVADTNLSYHQMEKELMITSSDPNIAFSKFSTHSRSQMLLWLLHLSCFKSGNSFQTHPMRHYLFQNNAHLFGSMTFPELKATYGRTLTWTATLWQIDAALCCLSLAPVFTEASLKLMATWEQPKAAGVVSFNMRQRCGLSQNQLLWPESHAATSSVCIWTTRAGPAALVRRGMIESPGISVENRARGSHRTPGQYQNRQLLLFTHYHLQAKSNWPRKKEPQQKTGEKKKKTKTYRVVIQTHGSVLMKLGANTKASTSSWRN